jgi:hypothetical protein
MTQDSQVEVPDLQAIAAIIRDAAQHYQGDVLGLLDLLRMLEKAHQEIREGFFQEALPTSRHELYALLRDIETQGGWPYIYSRQLRSLLNELVAASVRAAEASEPARDLPKEHNFPYLQDRNSVEL